MFNPVQDLQGFGQDQIAAATRSATAFGSGMQQVLAETTELSRRSLETGADALQSLMASKSVDGALKVQADFVRNVAESFVSGSTRIAGILSATAQECLKPMNDALQHWQVGRTNVAA